MKINDFISKLLIYVFECITFIYIVFKYFLYSRHIFPDTVSNIPLTIGIIFGVFLSPDEQSQDLAVQLQCGQ